MWGTRGGRVAVGAAAAVALAAGTVAWTARDDDGAAPGGPASTASTASTTTTRPLASDADRYQLAYLSSDDEQTTIFLTDGAGEDTDVVARLEGRAEALRWSPDGSQLLLDGDPTGDFEVYAVDAASGEVRNLTGAGDSAEGGASWSPDGTRVAFFSDREGGFAAYVAPAGGGAPQRVTPPGQVVSWVEWSPGGDQLVYVVAGTGVASEVWAVGADGSGPRRLTDLPGAAMPRFSPDGSQVALVGQPAGEATPDVYVVDVATGATERAGGSEHPDAFPTWSPDGSEIYFTGETPNEEEDGGAADDVYRVPADGGEVEVVTEDPVGVEAQPGLTADGRLLAFSIRRGGDQEVFVANADGSGAIPVSRSERADAFPAWRPGTGP